MRATSNGVLTTTILVLLLCVCNSPPTFYCRSTSFEDGLSWPTRTYWNESEVDSLRLERQIEGHLRQSSINRNGCGIARLRDWHRQQNSYICRGRSASSTNNATLDETQANGQTNRMTAGYIPSREEAPSFVAVNTPPIFCGGVLIAENLVATAAHCVPRNGGHAGVFVKVDSQIVNAAQVCKVPRGDIAIIRLARSLRISARIRPACVEMNRRPAQGSACLAVGDGRINRSMRRDPNGPRAMPMAQQPNCGWGFQRYDRDYKCYLSTGGFTGSTCPGDSGSPIFCFENCGGQTRMFVTGVLSWGPASQQVCTPGMKFISGYNDFVSTRNEFAATVAACSRGY